MMLTTPVMAAFNHCFGENLNPKQTLFFTTPDLDSTDKAAHLKCSNKNVKLCYATMHCHFHFCNTDLFLSDTPLYSDFYSPFKNALLTSSVYPPELKPPIN